MRTHGTGARSLLAGLGLVGAVLAGTTACGSDEPPLADIAGSAPVAGQIVDSSGAQTDLPPEVPGLPVAGGPVSITIDGRQGPIVPVGVDDDGVLLPPQDVSQLGWYLDSALPGSGGPGTVVVTGHINDAHQGWGFASNFADIAAGTEVTVSTSAGGEVRYRAVAASEHDLKADGVAEVVNDFTGPERLVFITCGGRYVGGRLGYESNIVTVFEPVPA